MNVEIRRDGITLRGQLDRSENKSEKGRDAKSPVLIIFHGFSGNLGYEKNDLYYKIAQSAVKSGFTVVRFDFNGHGKSDGDFSDMDVLREILDAIQILKYVQSLPDISDICVLGHSQGGVVGGILAGLYPDVIKKLILLAPAATLKEDAKRGFCMGTEYDTNHIPEKVLVDERHQVGGHYFRIAKYLPIYEVTAQFKGPVLLIHGIEDECVDYHASVEYSEWLDESELKLFSALSHGIEGDNQKEAIQEIINFISE